MSFCSFQMADTGEDDDEDRCGAPFTIFHTGTNRCDTVYGTFGLNANSDNSSSHLLLFSAGCLNIFLNDVSVRFCRKLAAAIYYSAMIP